MKNFLNISLNFVLIVAASGADISKYIFGGGNEEKEFDF